MVVSKESVFHFENKLKWAINGMKVLGINIKNLKEIVGQSLSFMLLAFLEFCLLDLKNRAMTSPAEIHVLNKATLFLLSHRLKKGLSHFHRLTVP